LPIVLTKHVGSYIKKKDALHRYLYSRVDVVTSISEVIRRNVIDTCPIDPAKVEIIYNGVNLERFAPTEENRRKIRSEFSFKETDVVIGMVGRMSPGKGHEEFLHAAKEILQKTADVKFLIVGGASFGEESYATKIQELCRSLRLEENVIFTGFRRDVPELMSAMDILAFPSHAEAFGNVAIEAMAMSLPVVSTNCDGIVDVVVDGVTGIHVPPKNSGALAEGLMRLIREPERRRRFGEAGRRRVEEMFDEKKQTEMLIARYMKLIDNSLRIGQTGE
jgi:glycosyltransferase involved in cell wall biosynthesis